MSQEEYSKTKHEVPYIYKIQNKNQFLYYFGEKHSFNPDDAEWIKAKELWNEFVKNTENQKRIVFVEGGVIKAKENEAKAVSEAGGTGLITFLASKDGVNVYCPEPDRKYERTNLEKSFSKEEIQYYYFARLVAQWWRKQEQRPEFEEYINPYLKRDKETSGWNDFDFSLDNMKKVHKKLFGIDFDLNDKKFFQDITTPVILKTVINKVCRTCSTMRNEYIVNEILKYWNQGYSIFVEYGASHAVIQEPLLREKLI